MQKKTIGRIIVYALIAGLATVTGNAQDNPALRLSMNPMLESRLQSVYFSDIGYLDESSAEHIFDLDIFNVNQEWDNVTLTLQIDGDGKTIIAFESDPFLLEQRTPPVPPGDLAWHATNVDLVTLKTFPGSSIRLHWHKTFTMPDDHFRTYFARTGQLDRGTYFFKAVLTNGNWTSEAQVRLVITNPSTVRLHSPADGEVVSTEFPLFQYDSDAEEFHIALYKKTGDRVDIESMLGGHPTMEYTTNLKQFNYNQTGGEPLESGQTYYWVVSNVIFASHGREEFRSPVWHFTVNTEMTPLSWLDLKTLLEPLLGQQATEIGKALTNYQLKTMTLNGDEITLQELYEVIDGYRSKEFDVQDVNLQ